MEKATPKITPTGLVSVCAWCYPGSTVLLDYPWLANLAGNGHKITHGICPRHIHALMSQIKSQRHNAPELLTPNEPVYS